MQALQLRLSLIPYIAVHIVTIYGMSHIHRSQSAKKDFATLEGVGRAVLLFPPCPPVLLTWVNKLFQRLYEVAHSLLTQILAA